MGVKADAAQPEGGRKEGDLDIVAVVGCLEESASRTWRLTHASDPVVNKTRATSMLELKEEAAKPLGEEQYQLLGASVFNPSSHKGEKMSVKDVLIKDAILSRINVTSQQMIGSSECGSEGAVPLYQSAVSPNFSVARKSQGRGPYNSL